MLTLQNVQINVQDFGSSFGVFLVAQDKEAINQRFYSFWNHQATNGELEWWSDTTAFFWIAGTKNQTPEEKLLIYLARAGLSEILNTEQTKGTNPWPRACEKALERYEQINRVQWLQTSTSLSLYDFADSVVAEKETGNFDDDVLAPSLERGGSNKDNLSAGVNTIERYNVERTLGKEEEEVSEDVPV